MKEGPRQAIRDALSRLGRQATPEQLVAELDRRGIEISPFFAAKVKASLDREEARAERERHKRPPKNKRRTRPQQRRIPPRRG